MAKKYSKKAQSSVKRAVKKKKAGKLKSGRDGKGGKVKSRKQAIAIGPSAARKKRTNMEESQLLASLKGSPFESHVDFFKTVLKPAVNIERWKSSAGKSRLGGSPDLPRDFKWPVHRSGPYRFIGQFDLSEISAAETGLPKSGLLSVFAADEPGGRSCWRDPGGIVAELFPDNVPLTTTTPPSPVRRETGVRVSLRATCDVPYDDHQAQFPFDLYDHSRTYRDMQESLHREDYLLGYPSHYSLGYNPTPGPEWCSLLTLKSHKDLGWCWHDANKLMVFIEADRLRSGDFTNLKSDAG